MSKQRQQKLLGVAILLAANAHSGQFDRGGKPYILHPLHLMNQLMFDTELATIAVLHDVIEDSHYTLEDLRNLKFSSRVVDAVSLLTHTGEYSYKEYIEGVATNYDAVRVKLKDLEHNSDITRLKGGLASVTEKDLQRTEKYQKAFTRLGEAKENFKGRES
jgi:(p)ppGpp synthase/HD superfamily hydrolase